MTFQQSYIALPFYHQFPCGATTTGLNHTSAGYSGGLLGQHPAERSDEFLMYTFKVRRCTRSRAHDWTDCPFAHRGEKAQRRDPRRFPYHGIACPEFRQTGECRKGQNCQYAHGIFEFWLHPTRYRTRLCEAGLACPRRVCFFAHTIEQLRPEAIRDCFRCELGGHLMNPRRSKRPTGPTAAVAVVAASSSSVGGRGAGDGDDDLHDLPHVDLIEELLK